MNVKHEKARQRRAAFVRELIRNGGNATRAYMAVYDCKYNSARSLASGLLKSPDVALMYLNLKETGPETGKARG